jgi:DeoR family transcriptional regulator, fructose operon transcriptional repressor
MLAAARQSVIVANIRRDGVVTVSELAEQFGVSEMTIRRDINALADLGLLQKVHGGAAFPGSLSTDEPGFEKKSIREEAEKASIAREALSFVTPGSAIGLSAGTTTWALAKLLSQRPGLKIVTNSVQIAEVFYRAHTNSTGERTTVVLTGGERTPSDALVGPIAINSLRQFHLDTLFLGVHGMDERAGFTTPNLLEAETNRVFASTARRVVVLADHTKWGTVGMNTITPLDEVHALVTDDGVSPAAHAVMAEHIPQVRIAPVQTPRIAQAAHTGS